MARTRSRFLAGLVPITALAACAQDSDYLNLTVAGDELGSGVAHVAVTQLATSETVACESAPVEGGRFEVALGPILQPKVEHRVDAFVDLDGDQHCEFGVDAVMSLVLEPLTESTDLTFPRGGDRIGDDPTGCLGFGGSSFRIELSGVTSNVVRYALVRLNSAGTEPDRVIDVGWTAANGDEAVIDLPGAGVAGRFYRIDFFEAADIDIPCTSTTPVFRESPGTPSAEPGLRCTPGTGAMALQVDLAGGDPETGDCASFAPST
jgi:hypothetical protein